MTTIDGYVTGYAPILDEISAKLGLGGWTIWNTGGGCLIAETRLETGDWVWLSDFDAGIYPVAKRQEMEAKGITIGFNISIYPSIEENEREYADYDVLLARVLHETATLDQLSGLVQLALTAVQTNAQHRFAVDGTHTVEYGVVRF